MSVNSTIDTDYIGARVGIVNLVPSAEELKRRIESALPGARVSVEDLTGGGDHFRAEVESERFEGLTRIEQHKLVYGVFGDEVGGPIHALSIKTSIPTGDPA
jgi:stress-induced morphogen